MSSYCSFKKTYEKGFGRKNTIFSFPFLSWFFSPSSFFLPEERTLFFRRFLSYSFLFFYSSSSDPFHFILVIFTERIFIKLFLQTEMRQEGTTCFFRFFFPFLFFSSLYFLFSFFCSFFHSIFIEEYSSRSLSCSFKERWARCPINRLIQLVLSVLFPSVMFFLVYLRSIRIRVYFLFYYPITKRHSFHSFWEINRAIMIT